MTDCATNIAKAQALKEEGNAAFKAGDYPKAIAAYHQIFMYVHGYSLSSGGSGGAGLPGQTTAPATVEEMAIIKELKLVHFNNLAMCHLKQTPPNLTKARDRCTKALELDPANVKALFRRGKCHAQLNALDEAKADLERVIELQPDNKDAARELRSLKGAFAALRKKEQRKFAGLFDRMQADEQREEAQAGHAAAADSSGTAAAAAAAGSAAGAPAPASAVAASAAMVDPASDATSADVAGAAAAAAAAAARAVGAAPMSMDGDDDDDDDDDEDMGEPLGAPQAFEPTDVSYPSAGSGAVPLS